MDEQDKYHLFCSKEKGGEIPALSYLHLQILSGYNKVGCACPIGGHNPYMVYT